MKISLSYDNEKPMYEQVKDAIKKAIFDGELRDMDALPSIRKLAEQLNVSLITTKRAYADLEYEGFLTSVTGKGTFVKVKDFDSIIRQREDKMLEQLNASVRECCEAQIPREKIIEKVDNIYGGCDNE